MYMNYNMLLNYLKLMEKLSYDKQNNKMAKFKIEYNIYIGDIVVFNDNGVKRQGTVQDVSQIPDIFVEGYNDDNKYTRWKLGIDSLEVVFSDHDDSGKYFSSEIAKEEPIEFVHGENFYDLIYTYNQDET